METSAQPQRLEIGGVLGEAWSLYTRFFVRFVTVAAIVFVALGLLDALVGAAVANIVVNSLIAPFVALAWTLTYFRLAGDPAAAAAAAPLPEPEPGTAV
jgi:hypothetical protein